MTTDRPVPASQHDLPFPPIRLLGPGDLRRCMALAADRGWSPERPKWSMLLAASQVFGIDAPSGRGLAGTVTLTRWGSGLASVGMMLVASRYGRQGLGRALMEHLLRAAGPDTTVTLFATSQGQPLYRKLGFEPVRDSVTYFGQLTAPAASAEGITASAEGITGPAEGITGPAEGITASAGGVAGPAGRIRLAAPADLPAILAVDRAAFGADRSVILSRFPRFADQIAVLDQGGGIEGYAAAWRNHATSTVIGPLVAPDGDAARRLVSYLAARARTAVRLDLDPGRPELPGWAQQHGLVAGDRTLVMARGPLTPRGQPERLFTPISVALA